MPTINYVKTKDFFIEKYTLKQPQGDMHYHHAYEIYYVLDGEREYFIGDKFFKVSSGDLVWVPKDMLHRTDGKGATRFLLYFKEDFWANTYPKRQSNGLPKISPSLFEQMTSMLTICEAFSWYSLRNMTKEKIAMKATTRSL